MAVYLMLVKLTGFVLRSPEDIAAFKQSFDRDFARDAAADPAHNAQRAQLHRAKDGVIKAITCEAEAARKVEIGRK